MCEEKKVKKYKINPPQNKIGATILFLYVIPKASKARQNV